MKLAILASGGLGFTLLSDLVSGREVVAIFTDRKSTAIIELATARQIACFVGNPRKGKSATFIADKEVDVLISINYLFLIEKDLIEWPTVAAFNIHGSLLPKYRGRTPHVWAIINNETETGITAHLIDEGCDTGAVLEQIRIPIGPLTTGGDLLEIFSRKYPVLI